MKRGAFILWAAAGFSVAAPVAWADSSHYEDQELMNFYANFEKALDSDAFLKDPSIAFPFFDEKSIRLFDLTLPEEFTAATFRGHFIKARMEVPEKIDFLDFNIHANGNLAFVSYIQHVTGTSKSGATFNVRLRATDGLEKIKGRWRIVHEHISIPLDDATMAAQMTEKQPDRITK
jgi:ketosteroid isomerase-like protein